MRKIAIWYLLYQLIKVMLVAPLTWNPVFVFAIGIVIHYIPNCADQERLVLAYTFAWTMAFPFAVVFLVSLSRKET